MNINYINSLKKYKVIIIVSCSIIALTIFFFLPPILLRIKVITNKDTVLYIPINADYSALKDSINKKLSTPKSFLKYSEKIELDKNFKPGRYVIKKGMRTYQLANNISKGYQSPLNLTLSGNIRGKEKLASILGKKLANDSSSFINYFNLPDTYKSNNLEKETFVSLFIPNTYEVYWTISPKEFVEKMAKENKKFWNKERTEKAATLKLSKEEISTLASIVCEESNCAEELPIIAGVYLNRLKNGMELGADPTIKFAWNDPSIKRILHKHLAIDSPYNTYKHIGLPPGPITIPSIAGIDAVLNYKKHNYLYFCASDKLNGMHNFAESFREHQNNARAYQRALNKLNIK